MKPSRAVLAALDILGSFEGVGHGQTLSDVSRSLGLPKASALRFLGALEERGFVSRDPGDKSYTLGARLWQLAQRSMSNDGLMRAARPLLLAMAESTGETAHVSVLDGREVTYLDVVDGPRRIRAYVSRGERLPAHCVASGKAILAFSEAAAIERLFATPLPKLTASTITRRGQFSAEIAKVRRQGYALNLGEWNDDVTGISAPVFSAGGMICGAIGISGPYARLDAAKAKSVADAVRGFADRLSSRLGHPPKWGAKRAGGFPEPAVNHHRQGAQS
ncbi:MAG: IclR family transcriptional regulator [Alphaproteobacteria bacterium]